MPQSAIDAGRRGLLPARSPSSPRSSCASAATLRRRARRPTAVESTTPRSSKILALVRSAVRRRLRRVQVADASSGGSRAGWPCAGWTTLARVLAPARADAGRGPRSSSRTSLIHVTSFFRDPEVFEALKTRRLPRDPEATSRTARAVRIWVAGCSTGEEVYSIAHRARSSSSASTSRDAPIQIFGSDISEKAIERARAGFYPESALRDVGDERRRRYFTKVDGGYRIDKTVRDLCVFVQHDLARDPPFSKLDLVSCRNVLIYFDQDAAEAGPPDVPLRPQPAGLSAARAERRTSPGSRSCSRRVDKANKIFARTRGAEHAPVRAALRGARRAAVVARVRANVRGERPAAASICRGTSIACSSPGTRRRASSSTRRWRSSQFRGQTRAHTSSPRPASRRTTS